METTMRVGDEVIQIVDTRLFYVKDADGNVVRIDVWTHTNGAGNIVIEYERTAQ